MTVRRKRRAPTDPAEVAAAVPAAALAAFPPEDYRTYFRDLTDEVEDLTGQRDHGFTMQVAEVLGISVVDWFKRQLIR